MFPDIDFTKNYLSGRCHHECKYCYVPTICKGNAVLEERYGGEEIRLIAKELNENLYKHGKKKFIFIQNMSDMFTENVPTPFIHKILEHHNKYPKNIYLYQSKNPRRFNNFIDKFPPNTVMSVTLETFDDYYVEDDISKAPSPYFRAISMVGIKHYLPESRLRVCIEPVMKFTTSIMVAGMVSIEPEQVWVGADSKKHNLPEPSESELVELVEELRKFTEVRLKNNLRRLAPSLFS